MKHIFSYRVFENKFKGYDVLDLKYDAPTYLTKPKDQKEFVKNNIDKLSNKDKIYKTYLDLMNALASDGKSTNKKVTGYVIIGYNNDTKVNVVYCGHNDKELLGYKHIILTNYGDLDDVIWGKTFGKAVVFKNKNDAKEVLNYIKDAEHYNMIDFSTKKITLNQGYYF